ncbi:MAG: hypothetical protein CO030_04990 [Candidatus Magasanikbacteria bacterium CG_4_9_14_0_2_um_filter_42_11]|uniref:DUF2779 domain-containing protein n=1 Tax=Candidatus Magasanikbacteria bacterium CG_4_9_14_0_2_um_filter_42_11 TaxID=1974643 RepID=A0A2M8F8I0_9BACT|nr:MAG: hypothetical protein COY70_05115 [Candidatus Magasanikbacteria bacterium CG_4_10_14_0_8_um_filter_42_12]PJC52032.1 MAG: hypothetical protein CO030_04990 [Candidatus Magasanikbacteria bacterium CG_4_9_14_0_2_um_filter_42_11]
MELSEFEKKIIEEGNIADEAARNLFPGGQLIDVVGMNAVPITKEILATKPDILFQAAFSYNEFFVQVDILRWNDEQTGWELYEVKATNAVKRTIPHHHVNDLAFQKIVLEKTGLKIVKAGVIHLNGEYRQKGALDYTELFVIADLTKEVRKAEQGVGDQMVDIQTYMAMDEEKNCECLYRGRNAQCTTFHYSNPKVPAYSVHDINCIGGSKNIFFDWIDRGIYALEDIDNPEALKGAKKSQYQAYMAGKPLVDTASIKKILGDLVFPLQFFDYEGYSSAIPRFDGFGAYEQVPFQYSLHTLHEDGTLEHKEYLVTDPERDLTRPLVERMRKDFDDEGTVISWYKSYESQRNDKLAELHPDHAEFLTGLNARMFDLMTIFSKNYYVDARFKGSASIKNILPVIVPTLTYKALGIQKGDQAVERWEKMIDEHTSQTEKDEMARDLLEYCALDTMAMVEIYRFLKKV